MNKKWDKYYNELEEFWVVDEYDNSKKEQLKKIKELYKSFDHDEQLLDFHKMLFPKAKVGLTFDGTSTVRKEDKITVLELDEERTFKNENNHHLIVGDNLHGLQNLQLTHNKKVNIIYIDPPYNTGGSSLGYRDQFGPNAWLNFMDERLLLAKELLTDDGVIFVSIDDNMMAEPKVLMNDIFGKENFVANFPRKTRSASNDSSTGVNIQLDYIICFSLNKKGKFEGFEKDLDSRYKNPDNDPLGSWVIADPTTKSGTDKDKYDIVSPIEGKIIPAPVSRYWCWNEKRFWELVDEGRIKFDSNNNRGFIFKRYKNELRSQKNLFNSFDLLQFNDNSYLNQVGTKQLNKEIFDGQEFFNSPKSSPLIKQILKNVKYTKNSTILDFFAGSGTTAQAVMELNAEDGGNRLFIGIQWDEQRDGSQSLEDGTVINAIDQITYERIRRVITQKDLVDKDLDKYIKSIEKKSKELNISSEEYLKSLQSNGLIVHNVVEKDISISSEDANIVNDFLNGKRIESYKELNKDIKSIDINQIYKVVK